jgi:endogenous inhibitor of DNA gyrase (YacG/DUF329 family)
MPDSYGNFCSVKCADVKLNELRKKMKDAVKNDSSHTKKLSKT